MALLIFHSSCIGYVLSLARMGLFHGTFKLRRLRGGPCIYSAQQAAHSVYEWVCVEDMVRMVLVTTDIVKNVAGMKKQ